jgi:hypothetical protein
MSSTAYHEFLREQLRAMKMRYPTLTHKERMAIISRLWKWQKIAPPPLSAEEAEAYTRFMRK